MGSNEHRVNSEENVWYLWIQHTRIVSCSHFYLDCICSVANKQMNKQKDKPCHLQSQHWRGRSRWLCVSLCEFGTTVAYVTTPRPPRTAYLDNVTRKKTNYPENNNKKPKSAVLWWLRILSIISPVSKRIMENANIRKLQWYTCIKQNVFHYVVFLKINDK